MPETDNDKPLTFENLPELCTVKELALFFRITVPTAKKWLNKNDLPSAFKIGGQWRIPKEDILALVKSMYGRKDEND